MPEAGREPWNPTEATERLRQMAKHPAFSIAYKVHATQRLAERGIIVSDLLHVLRGGFVYKDGVPATQHGYYKYEIQGIAPNSGGRAVCLVVIPNFERCKLKIVTVMWVDETETRAGTLMEDKT